MTLFRAFSQQKAVIKPPIAWQTPGSRRPNTPMGRILSVKLANSVDALTASEPQECGYEKTHLNFHF